MVMKVVILSIFINFLALSSVEASRGRIVGGSIARDGQFPYQAAIMEAIDGFVCNGFIINEFFIGTSAFCVMDYQSNEIEALVGTTSLIHGGSVYRIAQIILHNGFVPSIHLNDVAVIRTNLEITFTDKIRPINLGAILVNPGATVTLSGWGKTSHLHVQVSENLNSIQMQVITNSDCQARLTAMGQNPNVVFDNNFCTFNGIGQGACIGDAGSPIVISNQVVGINSWDDFCGL